MLAASSSESLFGLSNPLSPTITVVVLALIPFFILGATSFIKLSVVFQILRSAIGAQQVPSGVLIALLSFSLTLKIMSPVFSESKEILEGLLKDNQMTTAAQKKDQQMKIETLISSAKEVVKPFEIFLKKHSNQRERYFFATALSENSDAANGAQIKERIGPLFVDSSVIATESETFFTLLPAFILSELREAFLIGFLVFLPFLIVDLVIANLLVGLGMMMVSPVTVSLPFKIILFVLCDGWYLLSTSLVASYLT
jgi:type III secretion protein R